MSNLAKPLLAYILDDMELEIKNNIMESDKFGSQERYLQLRARAETRLMLLYEDWKELEPGDILYLEKRIRCCYYCNFDYMGRVKRFCMDCTKYNLK